MAFAGGNGTINNPYLVNDAASFLSITSDSSTVKNYYKQINHLDFSASGNVRGITNLYGEYDGNGFKMMNWNYTLASNSRISLMFGLVYGTVKNVEIDSTCSIYTSSTGTCIGIGALYTGGVIKNCINRGSISSNAGDAYAFTEFSDGSVIGCVNYGIVTGASYAAGIAGPISSSATVRITNCANYGKITSTTGEAVGIGVLGNSSSIIEDCYNAGEVDGFNSASGIFRNRSLSFTPSVLNCINVGILTGAICGGIGLYAHASQIIQDCFSLAPYMYRKSGSNSNMYRIIDTNPSGSNFSNNYALDTMEWRAL